MGKLNHPIQSNVVCSYTHMSYHPSICPSVCLSNTAGGISMKLSWLEQKKASSFFVAHQPVKSAMFTSSHTHKPHVETCTHTASDLWCIYVLQTATAVGCCCTVTMGLSVAVMRIGTNKDGCISVCVWGEGGANTKDCADLCVFESFLKHFFAQKHTSYGCLVSFWLYHLILICRLKDSSLIESRISEKALLLDKK